MKRYCVICGEVFETESRSVYKCDKHRKQACCDQGIDKGLRFCLSCGKLFTRYVNGAGRLYCSPIQLIYINGRQINACIPAAEAEGFDGAAINPHNPYNPKKKVKKLSITDIQKKAGQEHLTYGEYVAKYGL